MQGIEFWPLLMRPASHMRFLTPAPERLAAELERRGIAVDPTGDGPPAEVAWVWDPADRQAIARALASLRGDAAPGTELAVWSRNPTAWPWRRRRGAPWRDVDRCLQAAGWQPQARFLAPSDVHVRQVIDWSRYGEVPVVRHRRSPAWKNWLIRQRPLRALMPARLVRAVPHGEGPRDSVLDAILAAAGRGVGKDLVAERILVSANGVAIVLTRTRDGGTRGADAAASHGRAGPALKIALEAWSESRVSANAAALEWLQAEHGRLGRWTRALPRALGQGRTYSWLWSAEEQFDGREARGLKDGPRLEVMTKLQSFLDTLDAMGRSVVITTADVEEMVGSHMRAVRAQLHAEDVAPFMERWRDLLEQLEGVCLRLVPRHGDVKLGNVLVDASGEVRVLDWELWRPEGFPLLDRLHLALSELRDRRGWSLGTSIVRGILAGDLGEVADITLPALLQCDPRYRRVVGTLYWLERIGPLAARGRWPSPSWYQNNVQAVLAAPRVSDTEVVA